MPTVTINAVDYDVYTDVETADAFLGADFSAAAWRAETDADQQARALVTATRLLNRLDWAPDRDWPRPGTDDTQTGAIPQPLVDASIVLAKLIHAGSSVDSQPSNPDGNIRAQRAGSVSVEYFFSPEEPNRLPLEVMELVGPYLATVTIPNALAFGTCGESITCRPFDVGYENP